MNFGVDWARHGWLVASAQDKARPQVEFHSTIFEVWNRLPADGRMAIDIPIGLPTNGPRPCDQEAKTILGTRGNSVFYTPTRDAVYASNIEEAKEDQFSLGYSIQNQAWAIVPRIREVDQFLQIHENEINAGQVIETHPEVAYAALRGGEPVGKTKKEDRGETDRLELLRPHLRDIEAVFRNATSEFQGPDYASQFAHPDDILDAFAALLVARDGGRDPPRLPQSTSPNRDDELDRDCVIAYSNEVNWSPARPKQFEETTE
jgi:predicted RNase H-like nuclease